jgi:hypothetical protein
VPFTRAPASLPARRKRSCAGAVEEIDDLLGRAGFAQPWEDPRDAVSVSISVHVGHGVDGEGDVESELVRVAGGRLDAYAGSDAGDNNLRDAQPFQTLFEVRVRERSPRPLRHRVVSRLSVELGDEIGPSGGKLAAASLFRPARGRTIDVNEHDWQVMPTECVRQCASVFDDLGGWVGGGE